MIKGFHIAKNIWHLINTPFQKPKIYELFKALIFPLNWIMIQWEYLQANLNRQIAYSSQTIYLERGLNDIFNPGHNGIFGNPNNNIYIETTPGTARVFEFTESEVNDNPYEDLEPETWVTDNFNFLDNETGPGFYHYTVYAPASLSLNLLEVKGVIEKYNPVGKYYIILTY